MKVLPQASYPADMTEWTGNGLPPVGTRCTVTPHNTMWGFSYVAAYPCKVIAYHNDFVWLDYVGSLGVPVATRTEEADFSPLRTPEQIAEEERRVEIKHIQAASVANCGPYITESAAGAIYDAGYRKFEIVDGEA